MRDMRTVTKLERKFANALASGDAVIALLIHRQLCTTYISIMHDRRQSMLADMDAVEDAYLHECAKSEDGIFKGLAAAAIVFVLGAVYHQPVTDFIHWAFA
jgi:hypothetical protein